MDLFDDLITESEPDTEQVLPGRCVAEGSSVILHRNVFNRKDCARLYDSLINDVSWEQREVTVYGKKHLQPRLVAWYGDRGTPYSYAGLTLDPTPWSAPITEIKSVCEQLASVTFNSVLLNLYRDGSNTVGWHSDDEKELGTNPTIASVSFGATRRFDLRHKVTKETVKVPLNAGSVLLMAGNTQSLWFHQLPRTKKVNEPRINLTFRQISYV